MTRSRITETIRQKFRPIAAFAFVFAGAVTLAANTSGHGKPCNCSPGMADAEVVQWDLPAVGDATVGAITLDVHASHLGRLWYLSRQGDVKLYRLDPGNPAPRKDAAWTSYELNPLSVTTGGLFRIKVHKNDREVFVRTHSSLQSINTGNCTKVLTIENCDRTTWFDQLTDGFPDAVLHVSDLTSDDCNIYTTTAVFTDNDGVPETPTVLDPALSYLQQLSKCRVDSQNGSTGTTTVKRWRVGGNAGFCQESGASQPCISGVVVGKPHEYLVYFSQPGNNQIGELDVRTNNVRRWSLSKLGPDVTEPRQLDVDHDGTVWAVTGSGHLVRLDPKRNRMSKHQMPAGFGADPFGVAPDHGVVGYTNSAADQNKVAMLFPKGNTIYVGPTTECIQPTYQQLDFTVEQANVVRGTTPPVRRFVHAQITDKSDGVFVEGPVDEAGSMIPLGITPDQSHKIGTFFYAVGMSDNLMNRVGMITLPMKNQKHGHARDEDDHDRDGKRDDADDDDDDDGRKDHEDEDDDNDCIDDNVDDDDDNDGIKDSDDDKGRKENRETRSDDVASGQAADTS